MQRTSRAAPFLAIIASLVMFAPASSRLMAQESASADCGTLCKSCGSGKREGYDHHAQGKYFMDCVTSSTGCDACGQTLVSDFGKDDSEILALLTSTPLNSLHTVVSAMRNRLLVHPGRNIVAIRGNKCSPDAIVSVAFLPADRVAALAKAGMPRLDTFFAEGKKTSN